MNGKTDFYRAWSEYKAGFGNLSEEFWLGIALYCSCYHPHQNGVDPHNFISNWFLFLWLGNELLHNLTSIGSVSLRVDLRSGNDTAYARYTNFSVASEERNYTITVSGYTGTAGVLFFLQKT